MWVRSTLKNYRHVLHHEIDEVVSGPANPVRQPPQVQNYVHDTVRLSAKSLFWESVRRVLYWSETDIRKVRCVCECLSIYEEEARASHSACLRHQCARSAGAHSSSPWAVFLDLMQTRLTSSMVMSGSL